MTTGNLQAAIYCRISKDKVGSGLGIERQEQDCRALIARLGWTVAEVYVDNDLSAYSGKPRPSYQRLINDIHSGRIQAVVAWHTDRLHRSPRELEDYISACEPRSVPTHCVSAGELDLTTASGRMTARITGAVARNESEHLSERVRAKKSHMAAAGHYTGGPRPFGYTSDATDVVAEEADLIRESTRRLLAGESLYALAREWRERTGRDRSISTIRYILTNPRNAGLATYHKEIVGTGAWPAIISEDEHRAVDALLNDPSRSNYQGSRSLKWLGSGLYLCGVCGSDLRSAVAQHRDGRPRRIYRCRADTHLTIGAEDLDKYLMETASALLDRDGPGLMPDPEQELASDLHAEATTLRARADEIADAYGDGDLSRAQYVRQSGRIQQKLDEVNNRLATLVSGSALEGIATAEQPSAALHEQSISRQQAILDALMTVTIQPAKVGGRRHRGGFDYSRVQIEPRFGETSPASDL